MIYPRDEVDRAGKRAMRCPGVSLGLRGTIVWKVKCDHHELDAFGDRVIDLVDSGVEVISSDRRVMGRSEASQGHVVGDVDFNIFYSK